MFSRRGWKRSFGCSSRFEASLDQPVAADDVQNITVQKRKKGSGRLEKKPNPLNTRQVNPRLNRGYLNEERKKKEKEPIRTEE